MRAPTARPESVSLKLPRSKIIAPALEKLMPKVQTMEIAQMSMLRGLEKST